MGPVSWLGLRHRINAGMSPSVSSGGATHDQTLEREREIRRMPPLFPCFGWAIARAGLTRSRARSYAPPPPTASSWSYPHSCGA